MTNKLKKQVEVQGTKKLGSVKGVQALELKEMKQIEGGFLGAFLGGLALYLTVSAIEYPEDFYRGLTGR